MRRARKVAKKKTAKRKAARKTRAKKKVMAKKVRCAAKTKDGKQCKRYTDGRSKLCSLHKKRR